MAVGSEGSGGLLLTLVLPPLQGSGHMVPADKPGAAFDLFSKFLRGQSY